MTATLNRRLFLCAAGATGLAACTTAEQEAVFGAVLGARGVGDLTVAEAAAGIKAALDQGTGSAVSTVGRTGGYLDDATIRIPLPGRLAELQSSLGRFGLSGLLDDLEAQINRGAERAAPAARQIFVSAISAMTIDDALGIVRGGQTAATDYFRAKTTPSLVAAFTPPMEQALRQAGAIQTFDQLTAQLSSIPLAPQLGADAKTSLIEHGVERGLDGLFHYVAREEAAIRRDPAKRGSEILRRVFG